MSTSTWRRTLVEAVVNRKKQLELVIETSPVKKDSSEIRGLREEIAKKDRITVKKKTIYRNTLATKSF
jgi:hypothetical protein